MATKQPESAAAKTFDGFAGRVYELKNEAQFLRSLHSLPTEVMDEAGVKIQPYGDDRVIFPRNVRSMAALNLQPNEPQERFPAVDRRDGAGNWAQGHLCRKLTEARNGVSFSNYEVRLALRRIGGTGIALDKGVIDKAYGDAATSQDALRNLIDYLWSQEDSLCRKLTQPIPPPITPAEV